MKSDPAIQTERHSRVIIEYLVSDERARGNGSWSVVRKDGRSWSISFSGRVLPLRALQPFNLVFLGTSSLSRKKCGDIYQSEVEVTLELRECGLGYSHGFFLTRLYMGDRQPSPLQDNQNDMNCSELRARAD